MMNRSSWYVKFNAFVTIFSVFTGGLTPMRALHAEESACQATCDQYQASVDYLSKDPTCKSSSECQSCLAGITNNVQLPNYCLANKASKKASNAQIGSIVTYGAAAAVCTAACAFTWAGGDGVCTGATIASGVSEIALVAILNKDSKNLAKNLFTGALSGVGYGMMANMAGKGMTSLGMHIGDGASKGVATESNSNQACASAGIMAAIAIMKGLNKKKMDQSANSSCKNIDELASKTAGLTSCLSKFTPPNFGASFAAGAGSASPIEIISENDPTVAGIGAGDGVAEEILKSASNSMKPGMSVADFKKRLEGGEPLSKMLSGIVGSASPGFADQFAALEKQLGADSLSESGGKQIAGSGSKPSGGKEMNFSEIGFGSENSASGAAESELTISPDRKIASALNGSDIFHTGYGGTIFQIVSQSLVNQKPNLEALEPVLPLNRALAGLKNESKALPKKAGKK